MTKTLPILGVSLAAIFAIAFAAQDTTAAPIPDYLTITSAGDTGDQFVMKLKGDVKQLPAHKAEGIITFWAWVIPAESDEILRVAAVTIHHGANDHLLGLPRSTPVQSFHAHEASFSAPNSEGDICVQDLLSPKRDFRVQGDTVVLDSEGQSAAAVATGWINPVHYDDDGVIDCFKLEFPPADGPHVLPYIAP